MDQATFIQAIYQKKFESKITFPDKLLAEYFINGLFDLLFASNEQKYSKLVNVENEYTRVQNDFLHLISTLINHEDERKSIAANFFSAIPEMYDALIADAVATFEFDPAATSIEEVLIAYPGFYATYVYRISHQLYKQGIKTLPRILSEYAHSRTGIDIHPGAIIGKSFIIDHGTGIVIGETTSIGDNVKIYQGVTLGALNVAKMAASVKRHPTIEDNVTIYSGATILGGKTVVGKDSVIGGNVWLTYSVPQKSIVYHQSEIKIKDNSPLPEGLNFVI